MASLPNLALWDQGAPPPAARSPVTLAAVPGRPGTPACRSAHGRAPGARLRRAQVGHRQRQRAQDH